MIVFGHNNFRIKSFLPQEAGLPASEYNNISFEVRQKYFHLFWIPFFPIGKIWGLKKEGTDELYVIPHEIETIVKKNVSVSTPWYSFALFFVAFFAGLIFQLNVMQKEQNREDYFYNSLEESKTLIQYPTTGDFYEFSYYETKDSREKQDLLLKVKDYKDDRIRFNSVKEDFYAESRLSYKFDMNKEYLNIEENNFNPIYINKSILSSLLKQEYRNRYASEPNSIPNLDGFYRLERIKRMKLK